MKIEINDTKKWQYSLTLKIILLTVGGLFLLVPLEMIKSVEKYFNLIRANIRIEIKAIFTFNSEPIT